MSTAQVQPAVPSPMTTSSSIVGTSPFDPSSSMQYCFLPIRYPSLIAYYHLQKNAYWVPSEIDFSDGAESWNRLDDDQRRFISFVLFFFSQSDGIVVENLMENFKKETSEYKEVRYFYAMQEAIETIHNETYSLLIDTFIKDPEEKQRGFDAIHHYPSIGKMADWMFKYMDPAQGSLLERIMAFACVEGIFFSSAFCSIYWVKMRNLLEPLTRANELIAKDEALHVEFAGELGRVLVAEGKCSPMSRDRAMTIIGEAVAVASEFTRDALHVDLIGLSADEMVTYVQCCGDKIASLFGVEPIYHAVNPFSWMTMITLPNQTNFFERRNLVYNRPAMEVKKTESTGFNLDIDF